MYDIRSRLSGCASGQSSRTVGVPAPYSERQQEIHVFRSWGVRPRLLPQHRVPAITSLGHNTTNTVHYRVQCPCRALSVQLRGSPLVHRAVSPLQPGRVSPKPLSVRSSMQHLQRLRTQRTRLSHRANGQQAFRCTNNRLGRPFTWIGLSRPWPSTLNAHSLTLLCMTCVTVL
eukprot:scpid16736/ scgid2793/ 